MAERRRGRNSRGQPAAYQYALPAYYIVAPAEASSNLARYDGMRYGLRVPTDEDLIDMLREDPRRGFWRRGQASGADRHLCALGRLLRRLLPKGPKNQDADQAGLRSSLRDCRSDPDADHAVGRPSPSARIVPTIRSQMYLNDIFTVPANLAGLPGISVPAGLSEDNLPLGLQLMGRPFDEATIFRAAGVLEEAAGFDAAATLPRRGRDVMSDEKNLDPGGDRALGSGGRLRGARPGELERQAVLRRVSRVRWRPQQPCLPGRRRHAGHAAGR